MDTPVQAKTPRKRSAMARFFDYVKPYKGQLAWGLLLGVVRSNIPFILPWAIGRVVDQFMDHQGIPFTMWGMSMSWFFVCVALAASTVSPIVYWRSMIMGKVSQRVIFDLRYNLFQHIQRMSLSFFEKRQIGSILSRVITDINIAQNFVGNAMTNIAMDASRFIFALYLMFRFQWQLTCAALVIIPFYLVVVSRLRSRIKEASHKVQEKLEDISGSLHEKFSAVKVVQSFHRQKAEEMDFFSESREYLDYTLVSVRLQATAMAVSTGLTGIAPVLIALLGFHMVLGGTLTVGTVVAFGGYLALLYDPLTRFTDLNVIFLNAIASIERIFEIFDIHPEVTEEKNAKDLPQTKGAVQFDNVSFAYTPGLFVIKDLNFTIKQGERIALVGESGSGKTTILNLLLRFYDPQQGRILIDNHDIRKVSLRSLRNQVGVVLQESLLFSGSISDNIRYGRRNSSEKDVVEAARLANAHDFILAMPQGYQTKIGEKGLKLSGGQRQRVSLARVFLKNPKILILDEATSSLDSTSEGIIQEALDKLMEGRTTFIIAHRLSTVMSADQIIVMANGKLVEMGHHENLLKDAAGYYRKLYEEQFKSVLNKTGF